jgi:hypothetical protein
MTEKPEFTDDELLLISGIQHMAFCNLMMVLINYDGETTTPAGRKRVWKVARQSVNFGQRVQNSVFEGKVWSIRRSLKS